MTLPLFEPLTARPSYGVAKLNVPVAGEGAFTALPLPVSRTRRPPW